jgi:hypothetical protein
MDPAMIASWMLAELKRDGVLPQEAVVGEIEHKFGEQFVELNANGNASIRRDVLAAFRELSNETVVWERGERLWRMRETWDDPGRQQV